MLSGVEYFRDSEQVMVCTADVPMITGEMVDWLVEAFAQLPHGFIYPIVSKENTLARFPDLPRTFVKVREGSFTGGWQPDYTAFAGITLPREDHIADPDAKYFAVAFDRRARLGWKAPRIADEDPGYDNAHIIEVVCEDAPDAHMAALREMGVSYLFAGVHELDIGLALEKLYEKFGIRRLLLEGGSELNGAFRRADQIDALSLVIAPLTAAADSKPLFADGTMAGFVLRELRRTDGAVWLNYAKNDV